MGCSPALPEVGGWDLRLFTLSSGIGELALGVSVSSASWRVKEAPPHHLQEMLPQLFLNPSRSGGSSPHGSTVPVGTAVPAGLPFSPSPSFSSQGKPGSGGKGISLKAGCPMRPSDLESCSFPNELCILFPSFPSPSFLPSLLPSLPSSLFLFFVLPIRRP